MGSSYAVTAPLALVDGQARKLPLLYDYTKEKNTNQGCIIVAIWVERVSADHFQMSDMRH
jgi:hypothetical protein